jgi:hypothetical protein
MEFGIWLSDASVRMYSGRGGGGGANMSISSDIRAKTLDVPVTRSTGRIR